MLTTSLSHLPFERLIRILYFEGRTAKQIAQQVVYDLALVTPKADVIGTDPDISAFADMLSKELRGTPRRLQDVKKKRKKRKGRSKNQVEQRIYGFLGEGDDYTDMSPAEYLQAAGISNYVGPSNRKALARVCTLWAEPRAREVICGMLLADVPSGDIASFVEQRLRLPNMRGGTVKQKDINAFEQLLWDFTGYSREQISTYVRKTDVYIPSIAALRHGAGGLLYRLGLRELELPAVEMFNRIRTTAYLELDRAAYETVVDAGKFSRMYAVFENANAQYEARAQEDTAAFEQEVAQIEIAEKDDFRELNMIVALAQTNGDLDLLKKAHRTGIITDSDYTEYLSFLEEGNEMRHTDRSAIMEQLQRMKGSEEEDRLDEEEGDIRDFLGA